MDLPKIKVIKINKIGHDGENLNAQLVHQTHINWFNLIYGFNETAEQCSMNLSVVSNASKCSEDKIFMF